MKLDRRHITPGAARPSYAAVTATLALLVATSGGAYAAGMLAADSIGTRHLKDDAVTSAKVLDGSLKAKDLKPGLLSGGGVTGLEVVYESSGSGPAVSKAVEAICPSGKKASGGGHVIAGSGTTARVTVSTVGQVPTPNSWYVEAKEPTASGADWTLIAYAVCVTAQ